MNVLFLCTGKVHRRSLAREGIPTEGYHMVLSLDATGAYHRDFARQAGTSGLQFTTPVMLLLAEEPVCVERLQRLLQRSPMVQSRPVRVTTSRNATYAS